MIWRTEHRNWRIYWNIYRCLLFQILTLTQSSNVMNRTWDLSLKKHWLRPFQWVFLSMISYLLNLQEWLFWILGWVVITIYRYLSHYNGLVQYPCHKHLYQISDQNSSKTTPFWKDYTIIYRSSNNFFHKLLTMVSLRQLSLKKGL